MWSDRNHQVMYCTETCSTWSRPSLPGTEKRFYRSCPGRAHRDSMACIGPALVTWCYISGPPGKWLQILRMRGKIKRGYANKNLETTRATDETRGRPQEVHTLPRITDRSDAEPSMNPLCVCKATFWWPLGLLRVSGKGCALWPCTDMEMAWPLPTPHPGWMQLEHYAELTLMQFWISILI